MTGPGRIVSYGDEVTWHQVLQADLTWVDHPTVAKYFLTIALSIGLICRFRGRRDIEQVRRTVRRAERISEGLQASPVTVGVEAGPSNGPHTERHGG
jgi:hypothetical protein